MSNKPTAPGYALSDHALDDQLRCCEALPACAGMTRTVAGVDSPQRLQLSANQMPGLKALLTLTHDFHRAPGRVGILFSKETVQAPHIAQRRQRPDQAWHSGGSTSVPDSKAASNAPTSLAVACMPVA
ncbi:hypothetical protein [Metallibacterium sp.]